MKTAFASHCLTHQLPETCTSPVGPACPCCKRLLYTEMDASSLRSYWESQPGAYTLDHSPLFVYVRQSGAIELRSLREDA